MKPLIGINLDVTRGVPGKAPQVQLQITYYLAVQRAGGVPLLLPPMSNTDLEEVVSKLDGLLLIGGPDYCPSKYGELRSATVQLVDPLREDFDFRLVERILNHTEIPILGICAGAQLLNLALGGSLIQDIESHLPESHVIHTSEDGWARGFNNHAVVLQPDSRLAKIYRKERLNVPTSHHQAVKAIGHGLKVAAHADDGIVEAIEHVERPFTFGVQWHPERDFEGNKSLFTQFVRSSARKVAPRKVAAS